MRTIALLLTTCLLFLNTSCKKDTLEPETEAPPIVLTEKQQSVVDASNYFGFNMLREMNTEVGDSNFCISPLSISAALGMTWTGAKGNTADEMAEMLGFADMNTQEIKEVYKVLLNYLISSDPKAVLEIANSIWYRQGFSVIPSFLQDNQNYFNAEVNAADFSLPATVDLINNWVSDNTHGKIKSIVSQIDPATVMFLINATYFKGDWTYRFEEENTHTSDFNLASGSSVQVDMMKQEADLETLSNNLVQGVRLPYGNGRFYMLALLPANGNSIKDVLDQLDESTWQEWMGEFTQTNSLDLYLPKFKFKFKKPLRDMLLTLGMEDAFSPGIADFTGINAQGDLYVSEVQHKTFIDVNEKGTEAAAVTSVVINVTSVGPYLSFNQPFLFFIVEKHTGFVIFSGKVAEPEYS